LKFYLLKLLKKHTGLLLRQKKNWQENIIKGAEVTVQQEIEENKVEKDYLQLQRKKPTTHINKNSHQEVATPEGQDLIKEVGDLLSNFLYVISLGINHLNVQKTIPLVDEVKILSRHKKM